MRKTKGCYPPGSNLFYFYKNAFAGFSFLSELIIPPPLLKFNSVYAKN
ncbi:hypothetical protein HMPREF2534_04519 [Bacteroides thetaiotaomicron]|nr:hypothetical protein HMPREF2534_04519 [Bacteroides thetaiotaomicron]